MKKTLAVLLSALMLAGMIFSAGAFNASAAGESTAEVIDFDDDVGDGNIYSVIGSSTNIFWSAYDVDDTTTEMTYDPRVKLYKLMFYDVEPENEINMVVIKNHDPSALTYGNIMVTFDVVSKCDILIIFDAQKCEIDVLGEWVRNKEITAQSTEPGIEETTAEPTELGIEETTAEPTEPVVQNDEYTVKSLNYGFFPGDTLEAPMRYNEEDGLYLLTVQDVQPQTASICILKNGSVINGADDPYSFSVCESCNVTITYDPATEEINVVGDGLSYDTVVDVFSVIAAGNGEDTYLNGAVWDPVNTSNLMTEVSDGVWEMTMKDVFAFDNYHFKFVINSIDEDGNPTANPWMYTFGAADENQCPTGQVINAVYGGEDCVFTVPQDGSTVTLRFDIRRFNFSTKKGAKFSIDITPPSPYGVQVVNTGFYPNPPEVLMTYNENSGLYELLAENVTPQTIEFYITKDHEIAYGDPEAGIDYPYVFDVYVTCDVIITFDPITEKINVVGDGVFPMPELLVNSVIAVGNGEDTYLNDSNWDPCDTSNMLTEVSAGIWEMTMYDIYAFDNYNLKFVVDSVDEDGNPVSNPWRYVFGVEVDKEYPTGQEIDAVYNGKNCIFTVPEDGSTVTLRLDLRDFDFATKKGAKIKITVNSLIEEEPILGDVNGDRVVDILDAVLVQKYSADKAELNETQLLVADFNNDNKVDILDAAAIQKAAAEA